MAINPKYDEAIAASYAEADKLLGELNLTPEEATWARDQAKALFHSVTEKLLMQWETEAGAMQVGVVPAAVAYALVMTKDWAATVERIRSSVGARRRE